MSRFMNSKLGDRLPYLGLAALVLIVDQWSKSWIQGLLSHGSSRTVIDGLFDLTHLHNTGIAFGMLAGPGSRVRVVLLSGVAVAAVGVVVLYSLRTPASDRQFQVALGLILGGALGNLYDRVTLGYVTDFLYFHWGPYYWPAFNSADTAISIGVGLMALGIVRNDFRDRD